MKKPFVKTVNKFDPIEFLGISRLGVNEKESLRKKLKANISEYILIHLLEELPDSVDEKLKENKVNSIEQLENILKSYIPNLDTKIKQYLEEFKKQYRHERK